MKKIKTGYNGDTFYDERKNCIIKKYKKMPNARQSPFELFYGQINSVKILSKTYNKMIQTPKIIYINSEKLEWHQKYFEGTKFYHYLLLNVNKIYFNKLLLRQFNELGKFLGELHNSNFIKLKYNIPISKLHGDLSSHNIMFLKNKKIFLFDPSVFNSTSSIYVDLAKFILNLKLYNFLLDIFLSKSKLNKLELEFLKGYKMSINKYKFDQILLDKEILNLLKKERYYLSDSFMYKIKKFLMNLRNKKLYHKIKFQNR